MKRSKIIYSPKYSQRRYKEKYQINYEKKKIFYTIYIINKTDYYTTCIFINISYINIETQTKLLMINNIR